MSENATPPQDPGMPGSPSGAPGPSAGGPYPPPAQPYPPAGQYPPPGQYPPSGPSGPARSGADSFFDGIRRSGLVRSDERWVGGVAGGIALRLGIDPLIVRGLLAASALLGGLGFIVYGLGWLLLPEQRDGRIHLQQLFRGDFDAAVLGGFAALAVGLSFPETWGPGLWWGGDLGWLRGLLWIGAVVVVIVLVVKAASGRGDQVPPPRPGGPFPPPPTSQGPQGPQRPFGTTTPTPSGRPSAAAPPRRAEGPTTTMYPTQPSAHGVYPAAPAPGQGQPTATYASGAPQPAPHPAPQPYAGSYPAPGGPAHPQAPYVGPMRPQATMPPPVTLPRPPRRGPGAGTVGIVVALSLLTLAGLLYAERIGRFDGPVLLTAGSVAVVLLGLAIIVAGLRGRTSGGLGALAVITTLCLLPVAGLERADWDLTWNEGAAFGDLSYTPTDVASAEDGYSLGAGEARIDLTELPLGSDVVEVPVNVGAGDLTVVLPQDGAYRAEISVMAGEVRWLGDTVSTGAPGTTGDEVFESASVAAGAEPQIELDITVGAGTVSVVEEGR